MDFTKLKKLTIGGIELKQLFINGIQVWKSGYKNWVKYSTEADGKTIYNGGLGYKNGYRVRSGGAEAVQANAVCTGFIPVTGGDVILLSGADFSRVSTENAINVFDSNFTNLGQLVANMPNGGYGILASTYSAYAWNSIVEVKTGVWRWVALPPESGISYIRVTGCFNGVAGGVDGSKMIVTVNEKIT
jgi:hypothetical protein